MNVDFAMTYVRDPKLRHWRRREQEGTRTTNNNIYDAVYYCYCWASLRFKILVIRHPPKRIRKKVWRCVHYDTEAVVVCNLPTSHWKFVSRKCFRWHSTPMTNNIIWFVSLFGSREWLPVFVFGVFQIKKWTNK